MRSNRIPERVATRTLAHFALVLLAAPCLLFQTPPIAAASSPAGAEDGSAVADPQPATEEAVVPSGAEEPAGDVSATQSPTAEPTEATEPAVSRTPFQLMRLEMETIAEAGRARVAALGVEIARTEDLKARLELHRQVERAKLLTEIELFQAQIRFADQRGKTELATTLRETVASVAERNGIDLDTLAPAEPKNTNEPARP